MGSGYNTKRKIKEYRPGGSSGLLVKEPCNQKVAPLGSGFFFPMSILSSTFKNEEVHITRSFGGGVKPSVPGSWLINISKLCYSSLLVKPHLVKTLVENKTLITCCYNYEWTKDTIMYLYSI